jgi:hypothetical protein
MRNRCALYWHCGVALALGLMGAGPASAQVYDPAADFSPTSNPNSVWSYGWSASLGSTLTLYPSHVKMLNLDFWQIPPSGDNPPYVSHNGTTSTIVFASTATYPPGRLGLHPGPSGQYSVVRWTAPANQHVGVSGMFSPLDSTTTDVHILKNGLSLLVGEVNPSSPVPFSLATDVAPGDIIDFAVGRGTNGTNFFDSTGLSTTIAVPEPGTLALFGLAVSVGAWRRYRRPRTESAGLQSVR